MTGERCDICRGNRIVRLPIHRPVSAAPFSGEICPTVELNYREFPCPQCCEVVTLGQVGAIREETFAVSELRKDPDFVEYVRHSLAAEIGAQLLKSGYIKFRSGPDSDFKFQVVATVGVVHPSKLDTLEQRIAERQSEVARQVASEAARQIDNWSSHYGHSEILKRDARRLIDEALQNVLNRRAVSEPKQGSERRRPG